MGSVYSKLLRHLGDNDWESFPWKSWKSPVQQFKVLPTFATIEWTYRIAAWTCLLHGCKTNGIPLWFSAWLCGTANDIFFMFMPFCDNFWQAQASVMITPRLPLYIVEMYATIIYIATTAARQFNLPYVSEGALAGLLAHVLYGVYDINGPPFLWWTWHDNDPSISQRQQNAPIGSSMWILTYIGLHSLLLRWTEFSYARLSGDLRIFLERILAVLPAWTRPLSERLRLFKLLELLGALQHKLNCSPWALRIGFSGLVCTPLFMTLMGIFQILSLDTIGVPGRKTYRLTLLVYALLVLRGFAKAYKSGALALPKQKSTRAANKLLLCLTLSFYLINLGITYYGEPTKHVSTGVHQTYNETSKVVKDVMGFLREDHLGRAGPVGHSKHDYKLASPDEDGKSDAAGSKIITPTNELPNCAWYTVKGLPRQDKLGDLKLMATFATIGAIGYTAAFSNVGTLPAYI